MFSGVAMALTKKHQKKLAKVTKLADFITLVLATFETSIFKALNNGRVEEQEFGVLQTLYFKAPNELSNVDRKMEAETRTQLQKGYQTRSTIKRRPKKSEVS